MPFSYRVYGLDIESDIPLSLPEEGDGSLGAVRLREAGPEFFARETGPAREDDDWSGWFQYAALADGRSYVRGWQMGEFLVSADGASLFFRREAEASAAAFQVYLLGQALSFALLKLGYEPLHATALAFDDGRAIAVLGESGTGKSTLAAAFVAAGARMVTDDVLVTREEDGRVRAWPGPTRLKLFPNVAARFERDRSAGVTMNALTRKMVLPLGPSQVCERPVLLAAIYDIAPPAGRPGGGDVRIEPMTGRDAALALVGATFNQRYVTRARLERQFASAIALSQAVPVRRLVYPRVLARLAEVRAAVSADIAQAGALDLDAVETGAASR